MNPHAKRSLVFDRWENFFIGTCH